MLKKFIPLGMVHSLVVPCSGEHTLGKVHSVRYGTFRYGTKGSKGIGSPVITKPYSDEHTLGMVHSVRNSTKVSSHHHAVFERALNRATATKRAFCMFCLQTNESVPNRKTLFTLGPKSKSNIIYAAEKTTRASRSSRIDSFLTRDSSMATAPASFKSVTFFCGITTRLSFVKIILGLWTN